MAHEILSSRFKRITGEKTHPYPDVTSNDDLTATEMDEIRRATALAGKHSYFNAFNAEGVEAYGRRKRLELSDILVSRKQFRWIHPKSTDLGCGLHAVFRDKEGLLFPVGKCSYDDPGVVIRGIVVKDEKGRGWLCGEEAARESVVPGEVLENSKFVFTGEEPLQEISLETLPVVADFFVNPGLRPDLSRMPTFAGEFVMFHKTIGGTTGAPISVVTAGHDHLMPGLIRMNQRIDEILERERKILNAIEGIITEDAIRAVIGEKEFPITNDLFPEYQGAERKAFDERLEDLAKRTAIGLRDAELCAPCPNNGHHAVRGMKAWAMFLDGKIDGPASDYDGEEFYAAHMLDSAPFFKAFWSMVHEGISALHDKTWKEANPGETYDFKSIEPVGEAQYDAGISEMRKSMLTDIMREDTGHLFMSEFKSRLDSSLRITIADSFLKPVLATREGKRLIPLPFTKEPKHVRHLRFSVPSGRMVIAVQPQVEGFMKGVKNICEGDYYEIGNVDGLNLRARHYYERMGVAIVQITTHPNPYSDIPGVIRFGSVDEDHEALWSEKEGDAKFLGPKPAFEVSGGVWCRMMADFDAFVDVMMASGQYENRNDAMAALEDHVEETDDMAIINFDGDEAHLYSPTGYGECKESFSEKFHAAEMDFPEWRTDEFVLSNRPLDVDPSILEENDWVEGRIDPDITLRHDNDSPSP